MATIKITLRPDKAPQKIFDAGELAESLSGKKLLLPDFDTDNEEEVFTRVLADIPERMKDKTATAQNMKKRFSFATATKKAIAGKLGPGKHTVSLEVLGVGDREAGEFPVHVEIDEPVEEPEALDFDTLVSEGRITFASTKVEKLIKADKNNKAKAASIAERGSSYKGHGPTDALGGAIHTHVTNKTGIGLRFNGDVLHIVAFGVKSDSAGTGTSGYTWHQ